MHWVERLSKPYLAAMSFVFIVTLLLSLFIALALLLKLYHTHMGKTIKKAASPVTWSHWSSYRVCRNIMSTVLPHPHEKSDNFLPRGKITDFQELLHKTGVKKDDFFMIIWRGKGRRSPNLRAFWRSRKSPRIDKAFLIVSLYQMYQTPSNFWCFQGGKNQFSSNDI